MLVSFQALTMKTGSRVHPLVGNPPSWASGWGQDRYGVFVEIRVGEVVQKMRWIFPGTFWMGSPEEEAGRFEWEWPRHQVELTRGFWLADTPCTQEMWTEVVGENPSRFQSQKRPVERVSWNDIQNFLGRLHERRPELKLRLPTEAQWEYACRAGTKSATWLGDLDIQGANHAPILDTIAWYGGNSGQGFELDEGEDSSKWPEKHYEHEKAGSRQVATKVPNPWGLYDMLGNVWEWCSDFWDSPSAAEGTRIDPTGPKEGSDRVIRGGAWLDQARSVRAASRFWYDPGYRDHFLGFRLSRGQGRGASGAERL